MRVLWVGHNLAYPPKGGVSQRNYNLLRQVGKHHEVHVLAFDQPATRPKGVSPQDCVEALGRFCARVEWMPLQRHNTGFLKYVLAARACLSRTPYAMRWLSSPALVGRLGTILGNTHFDVVHFDTLALAPYLPYVYRSAVVLNHHNIESVMMERRASLERNPIRRCYFHSEVKKLRAAEHRWCPRFDLNLVVSEEEGELLSNRTNDVSWSVIANGVDVAYFRHESQPHGPSLLFCGGLSWYPNQDAMRYFFYSVWPLLIKSLPEVEIRVVGKSPPRWLENLSMQDPRIKATGFVDDVRPFFKQSTVYVCPIRNGGGTRLKILDALAMGLPIVATRFACSGLDMEDGKHVLFAESAEEFILQIQRLMSDCALWHCLSYSGRALVQQKYSWEIIGEDLCNGYQQAIQRFINRSRAGSKRISKGLT